MGILGFYIGQFEHFEYKNNTIMGDTPETSGVMDHRIANFPKKKHHICQDYCNKTQILMINVLSTIKDDPKQF